MNTFWFVSPDSRNQRPADFTPPPPLSIAEAMTWIDSEYRSVWARSEHDPDLPDPDLEPAKPRRGRKPKATADKTPQPKKRPGRPRKTQPDQPKTPSRRGRKPKAAQQPADPDGAVTAPFWFTSTTWPDMAGEIEIV